MDSLRKSTLSFSQRYLSQRLKKILTQSKVRVFHSASSAISKPTPNLTIPPTLMMRSSSSGKGLYAKQCIPANEKLFSEVPYFWVPGLRVFLRILESELCGYCGKEFKESSETLRIRCNSCPQSMLTDVIR
jgi:hypothetical protein